MHFLAKKTIPFVLGSISRAKPRPAPEYARQKRPALKIREEDSCFEGGRKKSVPRYEFRGAAPPWHLDVAKMKVTLTRFVAVLMLVVHLQANTVTWAAVENSSRLCLVGLRKGLLCCAQSCGMCSSHASRGCSKLPGGAQQCCHRAIRRSGRICSKASDVGCSIDATALHALVQPPRLKSLEPFEAGICATSDEIATKACYQLVEPQRVWGQCSYGVPCDPPCKHGVCFFGRCFYPPGSAASRSGCSGGLHLGACSDNSDVSADRCVVNIEYGAAVIPRARWQVAQGAEGRLWSKKRKGSGGGDQPWRPASAQGAQARDCV